MDAERVAAARAELDGVSDDAVVYLLYLSTMAMGLGIPDVPETAQMRAVIAATCDSYVTPDGPDKTPAPLSIRAQTRKVIERVFSLLPPRLN
jgi:hypothetical protein